MQNAHFCYSQSLKFVSNSFLFIFCICRDFEIYYQLPQSTETGKRPDVFLSLTSDFDLDAAFMSSSLPYLSLKVEPIISSGEYCTLCNRTLSESYTATLLEVLFLFKSHFLAFCSQTDIIIIYYMANPVLGKSLCSDWFFLGQDFARKRSNPCIFVLEQSRTFKICNQHNEIKGENCHSSH